MSPPHLHKHTDEVIPYLYCRSCTIIQADTYTLAHTHAHIHMHTCVHTYAHTCTHTHAHTCTHTCTHMHIQSHTHKASSPTFTAV